MKLLNEDKEQNDEELLNADADAVHSHSNPRGRWRILFRKHGTSHSLYKEGENVQPYKDLR
jgi:hypothetical protein